MCTRFHNGVWLYLCTSIFLFISFYCIPFIVLLWTCVWNKPEFTDWLIDWIIHTSLLCWLMPITVHMGGVMPNTQGTSQATECRTQRDIFWPVRDSLWRVTTKVLLVQHDIRWPVQAKIVSEFRKLHFKSDHSGKTAHSCNAEFVVTFCILVHQGQKIYIYIFIHLER